MPVKYLQDLIQGLQVEQIQGPANIPISKLCFNSNEVVPNSCFVAIPGTCADGHNYIDIAIKMQCHAIICEIIPSTLMRGITYVVVKSTTQALSTIASNFYDNPSRHLKIIAVTGTNGKSTIVHLLHHITTSLGYKTGMISTICNKVADQTYPTCHTTPDALRLQELFHAMYLAGCKYCFMEASSHAIVQHRLSSHMLDGAIFTNITPEHLNYHIDFKHYIQAKKTLFDNLPKKAFALINQDDKHSKVIVQNCASQIHHFSIRGYADFSARIISNTFQGLELEIDGQRIFSQLCGTFNASNLLAAYAASQLLKLDRTQSLINLSSAKPTLGRMHSIAQTRIQHALVDFAHTPDALKLVLENIRAMMTLKGRIITIMGCGGDRDRKNRPITGSILATCSDIVILTSDNPRHEEPEDIINDIKSGISENLLYKVLVITDRETALRAACFIAQRQDVILASGKGHQHYQEIKSTKYPFCDAQILQECLNSPLP